MKRILTSLAIVALLSTTSFAQFKFGAGVSLNIDDSFFGFQAKGNYVINEDYAGQASATFFLENNNVSFFTVDLDAIYSGFNIGDVEGFSVQALGGLNIATSSIDTGFGGSVGDTELGINVGVHSRFPIDDGNLEVYIEPKFVISGIDGLLISGGVFF